MGPLPIMTIKSTASNFYYSLKGLVGYSPVRVRVPRSAAMRIWWNWQTRQIEVILCFVFLNISHLWTERPAVNQTGAGSNPALTIKSAYCSFYRRLDETRNAPSDKR